MLGCMDSERSGSVLPSTIKFRVFARLRGATWHRPSCRPTYPGMHGSHASAHRALPCAGGHSRSPACPSRSGAWKAGTTQEQIQAVRMVTAHRTRSCRDTEHGRKHALGQCTCPGQSTEGGIVPLLTPAAMHPTSHAHATRPARTPGVRYSPTQESQTPERGEYHRSRYSHTDKPPPHT